MNPQRDTLSEALHELAVASPQAPSAEVGANLRSAFARHHAQRRRKRAAIAVGLAACLGVTAYWFGTGRQANSVKVVEPAPQSAQVASPASKLAASKSPEIPEPSVASTGMKPKDRTKQISKSHSHHVEEPSATMEAGDFVALPTFDPAIPLGQSRMVRMDLPGSDLQLIGYPVDGQLLDRRILTDVLVGQDGMPYAVRLVQARNVH